MFDFDDKEKKEKYYVRAEKQLKEAGIYGRLRVDRRRFDVQRNEIAKVHLIPWAKTEVPRSTLAKLKTLEGIVVTNDRYTRIRRIDQERMFENAHFEYKLDECDK